MPSGLLKLLFCEGRMSIVRLSHCYWYMTPYSMDVFVSAKKTHLNVDHLLVYRQALVETSEGRVGENHYKAGD